MTGKASHSIDFDDWSRLAAQDPEGFEKRRSEVLEDFIRRAPEERRLRLRRLQWRVDRARERAPTPLSACVKISQMMWDSLAGDDGLLDALEALRGNPGRSAPVRRKANVLEFRRPH